MIYLQDLMLRIRPGDGVSNKNMIDSLLPLWTRLREVEFTVVQK